MRDETTAGHAMPPAAMPPPATRTSQDPTTNTPGPQLRTWRFYAILTSLGVAGLASAIEGTIITSALPTISSALQAGDVYVWVPNAYLLASVAVLPLYGQASNIFGRRFLLLASVALFTLGSAVCGAATSIGMLIAARAVQGLGGGGINLLIETVVTDIVPLRERGKYMAIVMLGSVVGASVGPLLGGVITSRTTWRWCFYLNVPVGGAAFITLFAFLRVNHHRDQSWKARLARVDFSGNAIFIGAIVAVLIALTWGGTTYSWTTVHVLLPLILGFFGLFLFTAFEWTPRLCPEPSIPRKLVSNRQSAAALALTFIHAIVTFWTYYFLPLFFQAVQTRTPEASGIATLPIFGGSLLFSILGGVLLSKTGKYKPIHLAGFAILVIAFGLFSLFNHTTSTAAWVCFELLWAAGDGVLIAILLPAMQAPLDESLVATATGLWSFVRYFGCIWGVTIPSAIFNNECRRLARSMGDARIAGYLTGGRAYEFATKAFVDGIADAEVRRGVVGVFQGALRTVWLVGVGFAGLGFLVTFLEKDVLLREQVNSEFGMQEVKKTDELVVVAGEGGIPLASLSAATALTERGKSTSQMNIS
ncbi:major facilitator superfamily domain-containing protein [Neohortaea acidophila]|uniref:Major facilitator superfamily domain-containing protein n=1 Tax=Neohortaea acidophila TaxID=245834 RepID=A0A6A6Q1S5_9PEZI|nr:major facilitator superfamily domain-containing protein [Neohortaea acidophila]KAF2485971.1 major facilitator superfamily domain-containing protein [Neohortaea acidophila]